MATNGHRDLRNIVGGLATRGCRFVLSQMRCDCTDRHPEKPKLSTEPKGNEFDSLMFSGCALQKLLSECDFETVLDVGSGSGEHSRILAEHGKKVTAVDFGKSPYYAAHAESVTYIQGDYGEKNFPVQFDAVWASHVLEHQPNSQLFLKKLLGDCREGGGIAITVPPLKHEIVGGHVSLWNAGLLLYHLVLAGVDCRNACVLQYGYNISVIVQKKTIGDPPELCFDKGDITRLIDYFPDGLSEPFDGNIQRLSW